MLVAESYQVVEYVMYHADDGPVYDASYRIENALIGTVSMASNADYILLSQGRLLTIYDRGETNIDYVKA
jgi:hypothetical protein